MGEFVARNMQNLYKKINKRNLLHLVGYLYRNSEKNYVLTVTLNDPYMGRTAPLTSKRCILYIYSTNIGTEYFKHALYSPFFSLQNAVCFVMLTCLVPVLFTFYIQGVLKLKKNNSSAKRLRTYTKAVNTPLCYKIISEFFDVLRRYTV